jgi:hypothetical protein
MRKLQAMTRRWVVVLLVGALAGVAACSSASKKPGGQAGQSSTPPAAATVWDKTLDQIKPDGTVDTATALSAFVQAIGPVPGVTSPGPSKNITSGTIAVDWVIAHWDELTPQQQAAVQTDLGAPTPSGTHRFLGPDKATAAVASNGPNVPCLTKDSANAEDYRNAFNLLVGQMEAHLWPLRVRDHVVFAENTRQLGGAGDDAYSYGCVGAASVGDNDSREVSGCTIHFEPEGSVHGTNTNVSVILIHELTHCFMYSRFGAAATVHMPAWFKEGAPEWVGNTLASGDPDDEGWWDGYLDDVSRGRPLSQLTYDGLGFFVHLQESGTDGWAAIRAIAPALAKNPSTAAGWQAVNPSQAFLDSWGSGFVQGRYPGDAWHTGTANLDQYQPQLDTRELDNTASFPVRSLVAGTSTVDLEVTAEVVQFTPGSASGRLSLGDGQDVTLAATAGQNYCTLSAADCKCPPDSGKPEAQFTHLKAGNEWLGVTGGLSPATVGVQGMTLEEFCKPKPSCLVGAWTTTKITSLLDPHGSYGGNYNSSGGAGVHLNIDAKGKLAVLYDGMAPMSYQILPMKANPIGQILGNLTWHGTQNGTVTLPKGKTSTGAWLEDDGGNNVTISGAQTAPYDQEIPAGSTLNKYLAAQGGQGAMSAGLLSPDNPGTWTCTGNTLTITLTNTLPGKPATTAGPRKTGGPNIPAHPKTPGIDLTSTWTLTRG